MFVSQSEVLGLDDQTALLNSKPPTGDEKEDTRSANEKYQEWADGIRARLGIDSLTNNVPDNNNVLVAALAKIAATGAPEPVRVKNIVAYPGAPSMSFENEVLVFTHFQNPRLQYAAGEAWLALNPDVVINDLKAAGIRAKQD